MNKVRLSSIVHRSNMLNQDEYYILNLYIYKSIKLHSFVHYSPRDVHRIADKLNNAR